ncbi:ATP-binding cassette sub-family G member 8-like [Amphibalanus amphitrite]|uniref:ATP-binding cassette sub-family G member 8-like n=1 Tax=Amphibalanus amphitrite TaxID=1232801 RepID=UPI001C90FD92|nr:ATP-binding cassette sub-family G member 8-like [Amphibalanus amphitrite]
MRGRRSDSTEAWELGAMRRKYSSGPASQAGSAHHLAPGRPTSDELHAWSIYRQNLNSEFTDSALGSSDKSPLPYGNFQLRETTVHSILQHPKYGPKSELGANMYTYLKYGLPRVFPPSRPDGSSGYDSSDDGAGRSERYRRAKSNPDLRGVGAPPTRSFGDSVFRGRRPRSSSEANLLAADGGGYGRPVRSPETARSELAAQSAYTAQLERRRPASQRSRAGSHASLGSRLSRGAALGTAGFSRRGDAATYGKEPPMLNDKLFPKDQAADTKHPHLQVRDLTCERPERGGWRRLVEGVTFEARGGDLVGIMTTAEREGTALLDALADCGTRWSLRVTGDLLVNGCQVDPGRLARRVAYVQENCDFSPNMSVRQTMLFHAFLQEPGDVARGFNVKQKINALIEDLGLGQVKHTSVRDLTVSERRRLNVACHLSLDTDLVLLDQPTREMDIFDTFFLVEYLRQWAARGRIVMLTLQPPTYEIFTMLSKVMLISDRKVIYSGKRREMLPYFAFIDYPCPAYKNPSDYYLDLVTLDDLSPEATLESSQRVTELAQTFQRRQEPLADPGPPGLLPPKIRRANCCIQILALWIRAMVYTFPYNLIRWASSMTLACLMSVIVGTVFYDIRGDNKDQENVPDRLGFHYTVMALGLWPLLLLSVSEVWKEKDAVSRDVADRLYSRLSLVVSKLFYSFPGSVLQCLLLIVPAYKMAGTHPEESDMTFYLYMGYMLAYLLSLRLLAVAAAYLTSSRHLSAGWLAAALVPLLLVAGWSAHPQDLSPWTRWLRWVSVPGWVFGRLVWDELDGVRGLRCDRNPILPQSNTIIVQVDCGVQTGAQALRFLGVAPAERLPLAPLLAAAGTALVAALLATAAALCCRQRQRKSRGKNIKHS